MPHKATRRVRAAAHGRSGDLSVGAPPQRLLSLQRQHRALLRKIAGKQKDVERLKHQLEKAQQDLERHVEPIAARCRRTNAEIWRMFEMLLTSLPTKRGRRAVREVFEALVSQGVLLPIEAHDDPKFGEHDTPPPRERVQPTGGGYSAAPRGAEPGRDTLKAVFKRLTLAFHPDRTQDPAEKLARTALMQSVTQAFQTGDLASLLQLERKSAAPHASTAAPDATAQCLALERVCDELRLQLSELKQEARQLERSEALQFFSADSVDHAAKSLDRFVRTVEAELDELTRIRDFVAAFRDKKLTLDEFLCGPLFQFGGGEFDFDDLVRGLETAKPSGRGRHGARRNRRKR